jgi:hypothetical protein
MNASLQRMALAIRPPGLRSREILPKPRWRSPPLNVAAGVNLTLAAGHPRLQMATVKSATRHIQYWPMVLLFCGTAAFAPAKFQIDKAALERGYPFETNIELLEIP